MFKKTIAAVITLIFIFNLSGAAYGYGQSDQMHNDSGLVFYYKNQYQQALKEFESAARVNPNNPEAYYNIGRAQNQLNKLKEAEDALKKAVQLKPNYAVAKNLLKRVQAELSKQDKPGVATFSKKLKIQIPSELLYPYQDFTEGFYTYYSGDINGAKEQLEAQLKDKDKEKQIHARMDLGIIYYHLRYFDEAINHFNKLLERDPQNSNAFFNLGLSYEQASKVDQAIEAYETAYKINPSITQAKERLKMVKDNTLMNQMNIADSFYNKADWKNALAAYEKAKTYALANSSEYAKADSNGRVAKLQIERIGEQRSDINKGYLVRNTDFFDADKNPGRYHGNIVTWKGRIYKIEKSGSTTDILMVYLPNFRSDIDSTEYSKDLIFIVRFRRSPGQNELLREDSDVTVVGKIAGSEQLKNAFKYNNYTDKLIIEPLKISVTNRSYSGEFVWELTN
jgi:tetratricopeptide (TPR) repeat protein